MQLSDRPGSSLAISAHLLPSVLCKSKMSCSSYLFMGSFLINGSKWLCHLQTLCIDKWKTFYSVVLTNDCLPFSALFSSSATDSVVFLQHRSNEGPSFSAVVIDQIYYSFVFLHTQVNVKSFRQIINPLFISKSRQLDQKSSSIYYL